jgi:putative ABC transport system permease protein
MRLLRALTLLLLRGEHGEFIRHDLDEMRSRDLTRGVPVWRANIRYAQALAGSIFSVWRDAVEGLGEFRGGSIRQDLVFALRLFRKHLAPTSIVVGGLGLAVGVVTSAFTTVNATVLRPYGMREPASVVSVNHPNHPAWIGWSYGEFRRMRESSTLATLEGARPGRVEVSLRAASAGVTDRRMLVVTGGYLQMLGARPALGRVLLPTDDLPSAQPAVAVSHRFWEAELQSDPAAVGRPIWIDDVPATLVGVLERDFTGPVREPVSIWGTVAAFGKTYAGQGELTVEVYGRLAPGATGLTLQQNLRNVLERPGASHDSRDGSHRLGPQVYSAASPSAGYGESDVRMGVAIVFVVVALVLALACVNAASLLTASAMTRAREVGVRLAMGATRGRLIRQMLAESLLLATAAGALGFLIAFWLVPVFAAAVALPADTDLAPDWRVLMFTIGVTAACGIGAGLSPARCGTRGNVLVALQSQSGSRDGASMRPGNRRAFIGFQAAVSTLLLVIAALLTRSALTITRTNVGFDIDRLLAVSLEPSQRPIDESAYRAAAAAIRSVPSVESVSITEFEPFGGSRDRIRFTHGGRSHEITTTYADADYLATAGLRILRGRSLTREEIAAEAPVAVISESLAAAFLSSSNPIGQSLSFIPFPADRQPAPATIVGVINDAMMQRQGSERAGAIYRPIRRTPREMFTDRGVPIPPSLLVRTATPNVVVRRVEEVLRQIVPDVRPRTRVVREALEDYLDERQRLALLVTPIALLAMTLAALGVYGVTSFVVNQRVPEISIRMAIGATPAHVLQTLLKDSLRPVIAGLVVGLAVSLAVSRQVADEFAATSPHDPLAITAALAILLAGAFAAVILPVRRAVAMDPAKVLRES